MKIKLPTKQFIFPTLLLLLPALAAAESISGRVVAVADGDTLTILSHEKTEIKIRLAAIDAPEKAMPYGQRSKQSLSDLCFNKSASIEVIDTDRFGRTVGVVTCDRVNANETQVKAGMAWVYRKYAEGFGHLYPLEEAAKKSKRGLWADPDALAPWEWRKNNKNGRRP